MVKRSNNGNNRVPKWVEQMKNDQIELRHAIKLFLEEAREDRKQAAEDRKQAAEDRKEFKASIERYHAQASRDRKDIKLYFSKIMEEIHMDRIEARKDRRLIAAILRGFSSKQDKMLEKQDQMIDKLGSIDQVIDKLGSIEKLLRTRANGGPNGGEKRKKR